MTTKFSTNDIRTQFLKFFEGRGHKIVHSSSLVPANDPTLLFTNAGMVQFKDIFTGLETRDYKRATTAQRCVRAGGKHNDLENVGYTARHHTFFEMMGNFSFGDYFKRDAIQNAWDLLTTVFLLPPEKLWVTVYHEDDEAFDIWHRQIGLAPERIIRIGDKPGKAKYESDNFWAMGDTGPCGPCSEIFYDHGPEVWGGLPGSPEEDGDSYIEIWNLVFMQFERDASGQMKKLPKPSIDTGMGLERMAAVLQQVHSNYDIDIFQNLIRRAAELTGCGDLEHPSLKVIADHIRATVFLMVDGVLPANEGRGYVLRRIMRRAIRHGYKLGQKQPFFHQLVPTLVREMGDAYPEIVLAEKDISAAILREEERFALTLEGGMELLEKALENTQTIDGETIFRLYDTYGFPVDLTADIARERELALDLDGYEKLMAEQKARAKAAGKFTATVKLPVSGKTEFLGYEQLSAEATVQNIFVEASAVQNVSAGSEAVLVLDRTPFYAESGGQVGDQGTIRSGDGVFRVLDTQKQGDCFLHFGTVESGEIRVNSRATASVDEQRREAIQRHHSVTHLLHKALRDRLGTHVQQKGSLNDVSRTRFDFSHEGPLSAADWVAIEDAINRQILANGAVRTEVMGYEEAKNTGAMALFGEKYGDRVRVVFMGEDNYSVELCGGTHVKRLGEIGLAKLTAQSAVAAGIRRVELVTGLEALRLVRQQESLLQESAARLKVSPEALPGRIDSLQQQLKQQERDIAQLQQQLATGGGGDLSPQTINGWTVLALQRDQLDSGVLRDTADQLRDKYRADVVVLASADGDTARLVVSVAKGAAGLHAGNLIRDLARHIDGNGGGRPDFAQAGGKNPAGLPTALAALPTVLPPK